jgi:hypothetical protein
MEAHDCNWHEGARICINDRCPLHRAMRKFAANLYIAGALCAAFDSGRRWECTFRMSSGHAKERRARASREHFAPGHSIPRGPQGGE